METALAFVVLVALCCYCIQFYRAVKRVREHQAELKRNREGR